MLTYMIKYKDFSAAAYYIEPKSAVLTAQRVRLADIITILIAA